MITIKKPKEIALLREGGRLIADVLQQLGAAAQPGVTTQELDTLAEKLIRACGGEPAFKNYRSSKHEPPFPSTICTSVNNQVVHTPASEYVLQDGDIVSLDIGMKYPAGNGYFTDTAITVGVGKISKEAKKILQITHDSLLLGIKQVKPKGLVSDISRAVQEYVEAAGFSVVRELVGHGVGYEVHEEPRIPNYVGPHQPVVTLKPGMVIAIEPMVNSGDAAIDFLDDGWIVETADGSLSAHFEHTVVVTDTGYEILTLPSSGKA